MRVYIIRRLLLIIPTMIGMSMMVFFIMVISPGGIGGPLLTKTGDMKMNSDENLVREYIAKRYGLDKPPVVQYGRWLNHVSPVGFDLHDDGTIDWSKPEIKKPDLGQSLAFRRPVIDLLAERLPITMVISAISILIVYSIGIYGGIISAKRAGSLLDKGINSTQLALWSMPSIWTAVLMIGFLANREHLYWFPTGGLHEVGSDAMRYLPSWQNGVWQRGYLLDMLWHLALPIMCSVYAGFAFLTRLTRSSILENLHEDYIRTALAKGLDPQTILYRHVFRNSLLTLITVAAGIFPSLLGGSVIIETVFSIQGMGQLGVDAVRFRDREVILALTVVGGMVGLLSMLLRDICYAVADPRVSYE